MAIQTNPVVPNLTQLRNSQKPTETTVEPGGMGSTFGNMLEEVNQLQLNADEKQTEFMTSQNKDIHGTMVAMEKAEVSLKLLLQVRSKLTAAYEEISRMQI